jgi:tetratricopeptide (TPR) repeat protein
MVDRSSRSFLRRARAPFLVGLCAALCAVAPAAAAQAPSGQERAFDASITIKELFEKARQAFGLENHDLAEEFYTEILIREPSNVRAIVELANVYERRGKLEYAHGLLVRATKLAPTDAAIAQRRTNVERMLVSVLDGEVDVLIERGEYEQAIPKIAVLAGIAPDNAGVFYKRAVCMKEMGRLFAALAEVERALQLGQDKRFYELRDTIVSRMRQRETQEMRAQARQLAASDDPGAHDEALRVLAALLEDDPDDKWARAEFIRLSGGAPAAAADSAGSVSQWLSESGNTALGYTARVAALVERHFVLLVVFFGVLIVFRSPLARALAKRLAKKPLLSGQFSRFTFPEILLMLNAEPHTGVLYVRGQKCSGKIYFDRGEPYHCGVGKLVGTQALHRLLDDVDAGEFFFQDSSLPSRRTIDIPLSLILIEQARAASGAAPPPKEPAKKSRMKELLESREG